VTRGLLSLFIAYHLVVTIVASLPSGGPADEVQALARRWLLARFYTDAIASAQNWRFFSPEPPRENVYMRVLVEDRAGAVTDVEHDSYGRQRYPYLWYDHGRKVNRRLANEPLYARGYAAWVCRAWERTHGGTPPASVRFVRLAARIPTPAEAYATNGFDPMALPVRATDAGRYACADVPEGRLPDDLRRRFGLPPAETPFKRAEARTWWTERRRAGAPPAEAPARDDAPLE